MCLVKTIRHQSRVFLGTSEAVESRLSMPAWRIAKKQRVVEQLTDTIDGFDPDTDTLQWQKWHKTGNNNLRLGKVNIQAG